MMLPAHRIIRPAVHCRCLLRVVRRIATCHLQYNKTGATRVSSNVDEAQQSPLLHQPVMVNEMIDALDPQDGKTYIDMTYGAGGHTSALLQRAPNATVYCLDRDPTAYEIAKQHAEHNPNIIPLHGRFTDLPLLLHAHAKHQCENGGENRDNTHHSTNEASQERSTDNITHDTNNAQYRKHSMNSTSPYGEHVYVPSQNCRSKKKRHKHLGRISSALHSKQSRSSNATHSHRGTIYGVMFDVGASSMQFDSPERGFSIIRDGPLDMRMGGDSEEGTISADRVVNYLDRMSLYKILKRYGEEPRADAIAQAIVDSRHKRGPFTTTQQLAHVVELVYKTSHMGGPSHVATRTFQALRIFVNNELNELHNGLSIAHALLRSGGVCAALSFHSLEDLIIKRHFHGIDLDLKKNITIHQYARAAKRGEPYTSITDVVWDPMSRKVATPTDEEVYANVRARSAKFRSATKI